MSDSTADGNDDLETGSTALLQAHTPCTRLLRKGRNRGQPQASPSISAAASGEATRKSADTPEVDTTSSMGLLSKERKLNSSARHMRNLAEKMRRDKLNTYVSELAAIVPPVAESSKKVDKTSVLRLAANFIRMHNMLGAEALDESLPVEAERGLMETLGNRFLLVVTNTGKIVFVSDAIEQTFGHGQMELLGCSLYSFVHPDDCDLIRTQLTPSDITRRSFFCRFVEKSLSRNETRDYDIIHVQGTLRRVPQASQQTFIKQEMEELQDPSSSADNTLPPLRHRRSTRHYGSLHFSEDSSGSEECDDSRAPRGRDTHLLVSLVHLIKERPITELSRVESMRDEYITRHDACGTIMYSDHRVSYVTGYMPENILGASAFLYMHQNDLLWSMVAHKQMLGTEHGQGVVTFRLRCQDNSYVTLRSRGYLEFDKQTGEFESFVCINSLVDEQHSDDEIRKQRRQLLPVIAGASADDLLSKLTPELPLEILQILQNTLGEKSIQRLLAATAKFADKKPSSRDDVQPATITEVHEETLLHENKPIHVKGRGIPRRVEHDKSSQLRSPGEAGLRCKSKKKRWVTLNNPSCFGSDSSAQSRDCVGGMRRDTLKRNLSEHAWQNDYEGSEGVSIPPTCHITPIRGEDVSSCSSKRARHSLSEEQEDRVAAGSRSCPEKTSDIPEFGLHNNQCSETPSLSNTNIIGDAFSSQQALLESDARRKKQMIQMEQMAYNMEQIRALKRLPNSPSSVSDPEQATDAHQAGHTRQKLPSHQLNILLSDNVSQNYSSSPSYSKQQYHEHQLSNNNKGRLDVPTVNTAPSSMERHLSSSDDCNSPSFNSQSLTKTCSSSVSPQNSASFNYDPQTNLESVRVSSVSPTSDSSQSLTVPKTGVTNFGSNFCLNTNSTTQPHQSNHKSIYQRRCCPDSSLLDPLSSGQGTQRSRFSPYSPQSYTSHSSSSHSSTTSSVVAPSPGGETSPFAGASSDQQRTRKDYQNQGGPGIGS